MHYRSSKISLSGLTFRIITSSIDFDDFGILMTATFKSLREITLLWSLLIKCIRGLKMIIRLRVFKDLPKEFDTVDHSTLITNLTVVKSEMWYSLSNTKTTCKIIFFSVEMNIYKINVKTAVTWHHEYYGGQGYKKSNNLT